MSTTRLSPRIAAVASCVLLQLLAPVSGAAPLHARQNGALTAERTDTLALRRSFFGMKYVYADNTARYAVDPWIGASMRSSFLDVLAEHPPALEEARRASPYLVLKTVGSIGFTVGTVLFLMDAVNSPGRTPAELRANSTSNTLRDAFIYMGLPTIVMFAGASIAQGHINRAVDMFNEPRRTPADSDSPALGLRPLLGLGRDTREPRPVLFAGLVVSR